MFDERRREKLYMYSVIAILFIIMGIILFAFCNRVIKKNILATCIRILGIIFIIIGFFFLYLVLSGKLVLPLS